MIILRSADLVRQMVELYTRLTGAIIRHGLVLTGGGVETRLNMVKAARGLDPLAQ